MAYWMVRGGPPNLRSCTLVVGEDLRVTATLTIPAKEKKNRKLLTSVGCVLFSVNAHTLDKEVAYSAEERIWLEPPHPPLIIINFIKAKAGEGSSAARLPETVALEPTTCGAGTCVRQAG